MKYFATLLLAVPFLFAAEDVVTAVEGTVKKIDAGTKTVVIKTADGTEHTLHVVGKTAVHGTEAAAKDTKEGFHGLKEDSKVVAQYTVKGTKKTAVEIDHVGKEGLHVTEGTISKLDRGAKTMAVKTADGTEQTYRIASDATKNAGKGIASGTVKAEKVTVYYTEEAGHKVVHFFKKVAE